MQNFASFICCQHTLELCMCSNNVLNYWVYTYNFMLWWLLSLSEHEKRKFDLHHDHVHRRCGVERLIPDYMPHWHTQFSVVIPKSSCPCRRCQPTESVDTIRNGVISCFTPDNTCTKVDLFLYRDRSQCASSLYVRSSQLRCAFLDPLRH